MTTASHTATGLILGTTYEFTIEARNSVGYSAPSEILVVLHALAPEAPSAPVTTNNGIDVDISWTIPVDNGAEITSYTISLKKSDGQFVTETTNCDGSDSIIFQARLCTVPLSTLTAEPFALVFGNSIEAKIFATNIKGDSQESPEGNGATIIRVPDAPINLLEDTSVRTATDLGL